MAVKKVRGALRKSGCEAGGTRRPLWLKAARERGALLEGPPELGGPRPSVCPLLLPPERLVAASSDCIGLQQTTTLLTSLRFRTLKALPVAASPKNMCWLRSGILSRPTHNFLSEQAIQSTPGMPVGQEATLSRQVLYVR